MSDVPVGSYLSGGIDSGAIVIEAAKHLPLMQTFTIGFDITTANKFEMFFDERDQAKTIADIAQTKHHQTVLDAKMMEKCIDLVVYHLEEPRVGQSYPNYYAAKLAAQFGKVVLSGTGGDEIFGGYPWRYYYTQAPQSFENFIDGYFAKWQRLIAPELLSALLAPIRQEIKHVDVKQIFADVFHSQKRKEILTKEECLNYSFYLEAKTFLPGLLSVEDKLSMAHGLETRVPFLDNELVDFALKIPLKMRLGDDHQKACAIDENKIEQKHVMKFNNGKKLLRKVFSKYAPTVISERGKQGFSAPDASWFRNDSVDYVENLFFSKKSLIHELIDQKILKNLFDEHMQGKQNYRLFIWSFICLHRVFEIYNIKL